jgi:hypothetical protein
MVIKYTNIFYSKAVQNLPKLGFFVLKINHLATLFRAVTTEVVFVLQQSSVCRQPVNGEDIHIRIYFARSRTMEQR